MGRFINHSKTLFNHPPSMVYDHVADEKTWFKKTDYECRMQAGDRIRQQITVGSNTYIFKWRVITAIPGREFMVQMVNRIGCKDDGTPGADGTLTMSYEMESPAEGTTLFSQTLVLDLPRGVLIEDDVFLLLAKPNLFERVHENLGKRLKERTKKEQKELEKAKDPEYNENTDSNEEGEQEK
ncbi:hypothetical protein N7528_001056 [Penicillium herquei]|nr:hypothetical protein N7528_001056 [Penicillium herquei]